MHGKFKCSCGCGLDISDELRDKLIKIENLVKTYIGNDKYELNISSGARCVKYNRIINGAKHSAHIDGNAVDISFTYGLEAYALMRAFFSTGIDIRRIGVSDKFFHIDIGKEYPDKTGNYIQNTMWFYGDKK